MTDSPAIEVTGLGKRYGAITAVRDISFSVNRGEIFGLVGPDGAGKTTTIQMLCSLTIPSRGQARVLGRDVIRQAEAIKEKTGYMSERFTLYRSLTVAENLDFFARMRRIPGSTASARKRMLLEFSRLAGFETRKVENLSGGMQKKLALCCSLIHQPEVLFLDEPTTGVDPVSRRDFWRILSRFLSEGITILVSTPYLDEAERFTRVALIHDGSIIACDTPQKLKDRVAQKILEIRAEPLRGAVEALQSLSRPGRVNIFGDTIHVLADDPDILLPQITSLFTGRGIELINLRPVPPGLEDAFVAMLAPPEAPSKTAGPFMAEVPPDRIHEVDGTAVAVSGLTRRFGKFTAVDDVNFEVKRGEVFGFLGPNGSGKTTTIRMLCGLLEPTSGRGIVLGHDMARVAHFARQRIGYMSQRFSLFPTLSVEENIDFYARLYGLSRTALSRRKRWVLEMAGLRGKERTLPRDLSGGWKQRLALGCAIIHEPDVVFLDEPTAGVDPVSRRAFWELIQELAGRGAAIFITTHYMDEAEHCHRVGLMYQGQLIALGTPTYLKTEQVRGQLLEIITPEFSRAADILAAHSAYEHASFFGSTVHVVVQQPGAIEDIRAILEGAGIPIPAITPIPFSMEDVFISLIEQQSVAK